MKKKIVIGVVGVLLIVAAVICFLLFRKPAEVADINVNLSGLSVSEQDENIPFTVLISRKATSATTATLEVNGESYTGDIKLGEKECTILVPNPYKDDVYTGDQIVAAKVTGVTGKTIGNVDLQNATAEVTVSEITDTTTVELSTTDIHEGDPFVVFNVTLANPAHSDVEVDINVDGQEYTTDIKEGESTGIYKSKINEFSKSEQKFPSFICLFISGTASSQPNPWTGP